MWSGRALHVGCIACSHHIYLRKCPAEFIKEFAEVQIGQPGVHDDHLGKCVHCLAPGLSATLCLAHLPPQTSQYRAESLTETAVGTRHKAVRDRTRELACETTAAVAAIFQPS